MTVQVNAKYNQQPVLSYIYTYQNNTLMYGCYSTRLIVPSYTGPVFNVTRSIDNRSIDFYTDATQSYLTVGPNNTGTTYASWATGSSTIYLNTWYDQSGKANHCTQTNATFKPTIFLYSNKYVVYFNNSAAACYLSLNNPNSPYTILTNFNVVSNPTNYNSIICSTTISDYELRLSNSSVNGDNQGFLSSPRDWFPSQSGTKYNYVNGVSTTTITNGVSFNTLALSASIVNPYTLGLLGTDGIDKVARGLNGYMSEFIMYNTPLQPADLINYNNNKYL
jgi:hypothetical protein